MEAWLHDLTELSVLLIDAVALAFVLYGTSALIVGVARIAVKGNYPAGAHRSEAIRCLWLDYARWLVGALTVQLGADIIESAIAPSWESIGQLAAIALIRTVLNIFLARDMAEARARDTDGL